MGKTAHHNLDDLCINTIRMLSADAVEKAKSGHPGLPMGAAAFTYELWMNHLKFNPRDPDWINRDRFVLSAGHGSMLLYSLLHLTGYDVTLEDLKSFRQWNSKTPGHPEHGHTPGVETTTGPLGQGFANGVGMALAEKFLAKRFNKPGHEIIDYRTYALVSDGDLMEGISAEAASFAGGMKLGKLIYLYDSNRISIEGSTDIAFCDDTAKRFDSYGWHTIIVNDGNNIKSVGDAIQAAQKDKRPSLILLQTQIGFGSPNKHDTAAAHGSPLGEEELIKTKKNLNWPLKPDFYVPDEALEHFRTKTSDGEILQSEWSKRLKRYKKSFPQLASELDNLISGKYSSEWTDAIPTFKNDTPPMATREASGSVLNAVAAKLPLFLGGSADLGPSNNTHIKDFGDIAPYEWKEGAKNLHFGVREHAMGGILNGLALTKGIRPYGGTFLIFSDYMRASIRLAAIMKLPVIYVFTHDSIGQGEDGATHQPIEHLASLRAMPGINVIRPSDATETAAAWKQALSNTQGPTILALSRQKLPTIDRSKYATADNLKKGAYSLNDVANPDIVIVASGSEVSLGLEATIELKKLGVSARVVSMPSMELFEVQNEEYKNKVLPRSTPTLVIEAASSFGWGKYTGDNGDMITIDKFGASAPGATMLDKYGFNVKNVVSNAKALLK